MAEQSGKALRSGVGYTIGNILIKGINFLTLPLFSRLLSAEEFGVYNVFVSYDTIMFVVVGLAIHSSIKSANYEFRGEIDRYTSSVSLIYLLNMALLLTVALLFRNALSRLLALPPLAVSVLVLGSFAGAVVNLYNTRISLDYDYKRYMLVSALTSVGNVLVSLVLILTVFRDQRAMGRILGSVLPIFLVAVCLLLSFYRKAKPKFHKPYWRFAISYSLPIVPHGISQVLLAQFDRVMIRGITGDANAGIYSLAANLKLILVILTDSIATVWTTWFYKEIDRDNRKEIQNRASQLVWLFAIFATGLMALSPEAIWILGGEAYALGKFVAIPMVLDGFVQFCFNVVVPSEYYAKKTTYIMLGTLAAALINIVTNLIFIRQFGFLAAAYTTLFSYICYLVLHLVISRRLMGFFVLPPKTLLISAGLLSVLAAFNLWQVEHLLLRWGVCAVVVIPLGLWLLRQVKPGKETT